MREEGTTSEGSGEPESVQRGSSVREACPGRCGSAPEVPGREQVYVGRGGLLYPVAGGNRDAGPASCHSGKISSTQRSLSSWCSVGDSHGPGKGTSSPPCSRN